MPDEEKKQLRIQLVEHERRGDEYVAILERAYELELINHQEYIDAKIAAEETWIENLEDGFKRAEEAMETWYELAQRLGTELSDKFADELTAGIWDFIDGTKSADQAFKDFARSMLKYIGEMITKLLIMKAIQGIMGVGGASSDPGAGQEPGASDFHKGGIVGKEGTPVRITNPNMFANAKHYQEGGMVGGAVPIVAHAGEGVFTPEQMAAMGGQKIELTTINIQDFKMLNRSLYTSEGKNAMLNFMGSNAPMIKRIIG